MICTFFGHRDCPSSIKTDLKILIEKLITEHHVRTFYVGNHGNFDLLVQYILSDLKYTYPFINCYIILAYLPAKHTSYCFDTILPENIEYTPRKFAISYRNKWMIKKSDYVVTYVTRTYGGAAQFANMAQRQKKHCINIADRKQADISVC